MFAMDYRSLFNFIENEILDSVPASSLSILQEALSEALLVLLVGLLVAWLGRRCYGQSDSAAQKRGSKAFLQAKIETFNHADCSDANERLAKLPDAGLLGDQAANGCVTTNARDHTELAGLVTKVQQHIATNDVQAALRCLDNARKKQLHVPRHLQTSMINETIKAGYLDFAEAFLLREVTCGGHINPVTFRALITAWARKGKVERATKLAECAIEHGLEIDSTTLGLVVHAHAGTADAVAADKTFRSLASRMAGRPEVPAYNSLLDICGKAGNVALAEQWLETMRNEGVEPTVVSYTSVLHAYARMGDVGGAEQIFERMERAGICGTVVSFSSLLHSCVKKGDVARAEKWFQRMSTANVEANAVTYATMINICAKARNPDRAEHWFNVMVGAGVSPSVVCFNSLIDACAEVWQGPRAEAWLRKLLAEKKAIDREGRSGSSNNFGATRVSFTSAARGYALRGQWGDTERLFAEMEASGIAIDSFCLTVQLTSYAKARPPQRDRAEQAVRRYRSRCQLSKPTLVAMEHALGHERYRQLSQELGLYQ